MKPCIASPTGLKRRTHGVAGWRGCAQAAIERIKLTAQRHVSWKRAATMLLISALVVLGARARIPGAQALDTVRSAASMAFSSSAGNAGTSPVLAAGSASASSAPTPQPPAASPGVLPDGRVVLNVAGEEELRKLPKIGAKRAAAIVALRQRMGGKFRSVRDLMRVKGVGPRMMQKLQTMVVLDAPSPAVTPQ